MSGEEDECSDSSIGSGSDEEMKKNLEITYRRFVSEEQQENFQLTPDDYSAIYSDDVDSDDDIECGNGRPIKPEELWSNKEVKEAADLALDHYKSKTGKDLILEKLESGVYTIVSGKLFDLNLRVTDENGKLHLYKTTVYIAIHNDTLEITGELLDMMDNQASKQKLDKGKRLMKWNASMDSALMDALLKAYQQHKKPLLLWDQSVYSSVQSAVAAVSPHQADVIDIMGRIKTMKNEYLCLRNLISRNGFQWNSTEKTVVASDETWKVHLANPESREKFDRFRVSGPQWDFAKLKLIFGSEPGEVGDEEEIDFGEDDDFLPSRNLRRRKNTSEEN